MVPIQQPLRLTGCQSKGHRQSPFCLRPVLTAMAHGTQQGRQAMISRKKTHPIPGHCLSSSQIPQPESERHPVAPLPGPVERIGRREPAQGLLISQPDTQAFGPWRRHSRRQSQLPHRA